MAVNFGNVEVRDPSTRALAMAYRAFRAGSGIQTMAATTETPLLILENPSGAKIPLTVFLKKLLVITSGHIGLFKLYVNPTGVTGGAAKTPLNLRVNASSPPSQALAYSLPTVSTNGTILGAWNGSNVDAILNEVLILDPGNSLLVTVTAQAISDQVDAQFDWSES